MRPQKPFGFPSICDSLKLKLRLQKSFLRSQKPFGFPSICDTYISKRINNSRLSLKSLSAFRRFATNSLKPISAMPLNSLKSLSAFRRFATAEKQMKSVKLRLSQKPFGFPSICDMLKSRLNSRTICGVSKAFRLSVDLRQLAPCKNFWKEQGSQKPFGFPSICDSCFRKRTCPRECVSKAFRLSVDLRLFMETQKFPEMQTVSKAFRLSVDLRQCYIMVTTNSDKVCLKSLSAFRRFATLSRP